MLSLIVPVLAEEFPDARYIWLIRNGLDMVASAYQKQWYTRHSENYERYEDCSPLKKAWIGGRIQGDRCGSMSSAEWANLDRFGRCCWYWSYVNQLIERDLKKYAPDRYFILRLEEINKKLLNLIDWMGLKVSTAPTAGRENIARRIPYHWTDWSAQEQRTFQFWCGDLMDRFYPLWRTCISKEVKLFVTQYLRLLKRKLEEASAQVQQQRKQLKHLREQRDSLKAERDSLLNSFSWKLTRPVRAVGRTEVGRALKRLKGG